MNNSTSPGPTHPAVNSSLKRQPPWGQTLPNRPDSRWRLGYGMTLIELLVFLGGAAFAAVVGFPLASRTKSVWLGVGGGLAATICLFACCSGLITMYCRTFPLRPACKRGKCRSSDYCWDEEDFQRFLKDHGPRKWTVFVCKCGDRYLRQGRCFSELLPDGTTKPYMCYPRLWRRWRANRSPVIK